MSLRIAFDLDGTLADLDSALEAVAGELFPQQQNPAKNPARAGSREDDVTSTPSADAGLRSENGRVRSPSTEPVEEPSAADEGEALTPEEEQLEPARVRALTRRQQQDVWDAVRRTTNFWETLGETEPGIVARLAGIAEQRRWEVLFITQRPAADGDTTQRQSQRWLARHGFEMPSVFVLSAGASRGKVASALSLDIVVDDRTENCLDVKVDSQARAFLVAREPGENMAANASRLGIEVVQSIGECLDRLIATPAEKPGLLGRLRRMIGVQTGWDS